MALDSSSGYKLKKRVKLSSSKSNSTYKGSSRPSGRRSDDDTVPRKSSKTNSSYNRSRRTSSQRSDDDTVPRKSSKTNSSYNRSRRTSSQRSDDDTIPQKSSKTNSSYKGSSRPSRQRTGDDTIPQKSSKTNSSYKGSSSQRSDDDTIPRKSGKTNSSYSRPRNQRSEDDTIPLKSSKVSYINKKRVDADKDDHMIEIPRTMWVASKKNQRSTSSVKTTSYAGKGTTSVFKTKSPRGDDGKYGTRKQSYRKKDELDKNGDESRRKHSDVSSFKAHKKQAFADKRDLGDDSDIQEEKPRKRRRIKLDPYDDSNKRIHDVVLDEGENKKNEKKVVEMSKNAQFRAIQPSRSILSYVEENLLGRRRLIELSRAGYNIELPAPLDNIPNSTSTERERIEETLFRNKLEFFAAANVSRSFPAPEAPEIAFAGRSNVGKSSLLNALTRQWGVARTSDKPGMTQTINFFRLGSKVRLVDLPGYGFAYAKDEVKEAWEELVREYVSTRSSLKQVCLLVDTKWGMRPRDEELIDLMERSNTKYQIVLTKTDIIKPMDVARRAMLIEERLKKNRSIVQPLMMVSSRSGAGIGSLRTALAKIAKFAKF